MNKPLTGAALRLSKIADLCWPHSRDHTVEALLAEVVAEAQVEERDALLDIVTQEARASVAAGETMASSRLARVSALIASRGAK